MSEEILDLTTVVERDRVRIRTKRQPDGKLYELLNLDEIGPYEHATINARYAEAQKLLDGHRLTPKQKSAVTKALGDIVSLLVIDLEPAVLKEMEQTQRAKLVQAWAARHATGAEGNSPAAPTTAASSRASRRSSAATPKRGSTSRRG
jgi:hypothetical protein